MLKQQNRVLTPDPEPEKGHFYRSDHFSLAKVGVPMLSPAGNAWPEWYRDDEFRAIRDQSMTVH